MAEANEVVRTAPSTEDALNKMNVPVGPPLSMATINQAAKKAGESLLVVSIPKAFLLNLDFTSGSLAPYKGHTVKVPEGNFQMPRAVADHWWVKAHKVKKYEEPKAEDGPYQNVIPEPEVGSSVAPNMVLPEQPEPINAPAEPAKAPEPAEPAKARKRGD